ncbi:hypothetical protein [Bacterioplanoides pacificum]|uniref:HEAT repeat domain-containing protein n=1 Tax=Bacterioplanoides pacificum TaxID=1171596 RepID=A0ABV7VTQ1_9GAMM
MLKFLTPALATLALLIAGLSLKQQSATQVQINPPLTPDLPPLISDDAGLSHEESLRAALHNIERALRQQHQTLQQLQTDLAKLQRQSAPTEAEQEYQQLLDGLPADFEQRLKTDPGYADQKLNEFYNQVLDVNSSDELRLRAVRQLMMVSGTINAPDGVYGNRELARALLQLADNSTDQASRIKALEHLSYVGVSDPGLSNRFFQLLETDNNPYIRSLASDSLAGLLFNQELPVSQRQPIFDKISLLMRQGDDKTQALLKRQFGSPEQLEKMAELHQSH